VTCTGGENASTMVSDPVVIFEVLSPSTAATDRITKAREYQAMPSVQRYVMLEQDRIGATVYTRASGDWKHQILIEDSILVLPEIGVELSLTELYEGLVFDWDAGADQLPTSEPA
jgi:Uma2 family endonuclease